MSYWEWVWACPHPFPVASRAHTVHGLYPTQGRRKRPHPSSTPSPPLLISSIIIRSLLLADNQVAETDMLTINRVEVLYVECTCRHLLLLVVGKSRCRKVFGKLCACINHVKPRGIRIDKFFHEMGV